MEVITGTCIKVRTIKDGWSQEDLINPLGNNTFQDITDKDYPTMHTKLIDMVDRLVATNKPHRMLRDHPHNITLNHHTHKPLFTIHFHMTLTRSHHTNHFMSQMNHT